MTSVSKTGGETKVIIQHNDGTQASSSNAAAEGLKAAFSYKQEEVQAQKPLKSQDLNYENFPKNSRKDASDYAGRSLNEVKDAARDFNADFPEKPYVVDYDGFPRPEHFHKKNYGGDKQAYEAWKDAVTEWVEDCKQDMATRKSNNLDSLTKNFERAMNNGFFNIYLQMGITRDFIQATYEALDGNMNQIKEKLDKKAQEIMQNSRRVGEQVTSDVEDAVYDSSDGIHHHIDDAKKDTISEITDVIDYKNKQQTEELQKTIAAEHRDTRNSIKTAKEETQEINALSTAISAALHDWQDILRTDDILNKIEAYKLEIIQSTKVDHAKKLELLDKLLNLINTDGFIRDSELEEIVTETRRII